MMTDLKEDYYFNYVPRHEASNPQIDWKAYNTSLNVVLTYSALEGRLARFLSEWDLFPSAFNLLTILARTEGQQGMHLSKISELLAVSRANVTGLVDVLARKGLVKRISSPADRRVRLAVLTEKGSQLIHEILPRYYELNKSVCSVITEDEMTALAKSLSKIRGRVAEEMQNSNGSAPVQNHDVEMAQNN